MSPIQVLPGVNMPVDGPTVSGRPSGSGRNCGCNGGRAPTYGGGGGTVSQYPAHGS